MPATKLVRDLMSSNVTTLEAHESLSIADRVMNLGRIRHMPVMSEGKLVGLLSQRSLLHNALSEALGGTPANNIQTLDSIKIADCMVKDPITCTSDTTLAEAAKIMLKHKYGCLPVVDGDTLVGILTESDFVAAFVS